MQGELHAGDPAVGVLSEVATLDRGEVRQSALIDDGVDFCGVEAQIVHVDFQECAVHAQSGDVDGQRRASEQHQMGVRGRVVDQHLKMTDSRCAAQQMHVVEDEQEWAIDALQRAQKFMEERIVSELAGGMQPYGIVQCGEVFFQRCAKIVEEEILFVVLFAERPPCGADFLV